MIKIKSITMKNFMSIGNVTQSIILDQEDIILVVGENLDLGGNDSRNGCGKTTILNALSYALFGEPLTKIKMNNLINKTNSKNMLVTVDFEKDGNLFHVERGRKPDCFCFIHNEEDLADEKTQGDSRITQKDIESILGFNHLMFKHIIALNTYTVPFLSSIASDQRDIIEDLLGISALSQKAETLKDKIKQTKDALKEEESIVKSALDFNASIDKSIQGLQVKKDQWDADKQKNLISMANDLDLLQTLDITVEIQNHEHNKNVDDVLSQRKVLETSLFHLNRNIKTLNSNIHTTEQKIISISENTCPTCGQEYHDHESVLMDLASTYETDQIMLSQHINDVQDINIKLGALIVLDKKNTYYSSVTEAYDHKNRIDKITSRLITLDDSVNPYEDQITALNKEIKEVSYDNMTILSEYKDHQEFMLKLLTNKDSFIRKKIINQNISFLNSRLEHYLFKIGLPHTVKFMPDLEVEITLLGKDLDFDNLSRGERTRLILSLSWAFRDCYESLNDAINIMFVDELIDTGLDPIGVEGALGVLKEMNRKNKKSIFLISHKDELLGRVDTTLKVIKENGFTSFEQN